MSHAADAKALKVELYGTEGPKKCRHTGDLFGGAQLARPAALSWSEKLPVPCPRDYCGAAVGVPCRSAQGNLTTTHAARVQAAQDAGRVCWSPGFAELETMQREERRKPRHQIDLF